MKKWCIFAFLIVFLSGLSPSLIAQQDYYPHLGVTIIQEEDGSPQIVISGGQPLVVSNGTLTLNPDGTISLATTGCESVTAPIDSAYIVQGYSATLTHERVITEGEGIDVTDEGSNAPMTVGCEKATYTNLGVASFNNLQFTVIDGVVTLRAISSGLLPAGVVGTDEIEDGSVGADDLAPNSVGSSEIASDAVGSDEIAPGAVGASEIAQDAVGSSEIAANAVGSSEIGPGAVGASELAPSGVVAGNYTNTNVTVDADGRITAAANGEAGTGTNGGITELSEDLTPELGGPMAMRTHNITGVTGFLNLEYFGCRDANASPDTVGKLLYDNTVLGLEDGAYAWYDGDEIRYFIDLDTLPSNDGYVVSYNATLGKFVMAAGAGTTEEQVEDYVGGMLGGTETRITVTYNDAGNAINFVVDDMNDDVPEAGDFGAAADLDANGQVADDSHNHVAGNIDETTSATWAGRVSDETGTGAQVYANSPTLVTPVLGAATATSLAASGNITGEVPVTLDTVAAVDLSTATNTRGHVRINNDVDAIDYTLPPAEAGLVIMFYDIAGGVITVDPDDGTDTIYLNGASVGAGDAIDSPGSAGDYICLMALDATKWVTVGRSGTWVDGGVD